MNLNKNIRSAGILKWRPGRFAAFLCLTFLLNNVPAQETLRPLGGNLNYIYRELRKDTPRSYSSSARSAASVTLSLPFKEDFYYASTQSYPDQSLWMDSSTYVNTGHAIAPPSIGVATFDGLGKMGYPYTPALLNMNQSLPADTLTSRPIDLFSAGSVTLQPSDSVALTFYYEARGFGDNPESTDSLLLDFFKPAQNAWENVWYSRGNTSSNTNDTIFKRGFVWITDTAYLQNGFQFRFRNKATTAGDFDHWHLDYIYLDKGRSELADTLYDDIAFGFVPTPLLYRYSAMPWQQYNSSAKAASNSVFIRNNGKETINMTYENRMFDNLNALTYTYTGGANPGLDPFKTTGWSAFAPHANPAFSHTFAPFSDSIDFRIKHYIYRSGTSVDFFPGNDTVIQEQRFRNYYAFDDGSAEAAYYVSGQNVKIVQRIVLSVADTLRAVRIFFDPIGNYNTNYNFRIDVWNETVSVPGILLYRDSTVSAKYLNAGFNATPEYTLTSPLLLPAGTYYIGIKQEIATGIGIGFDRNLNHMSDLYYDSGSGWTQSQIPGSLMIRPVFGAKVPPPVSVKENQDQFHEIKIWPNPANEQLMVKSDKNEKISYSLTDISGRLLKESNEESELHTISCWHLKAGVYFLVIRSGNRFVAGRKIIVQH